MTHTPEPAFRSLDHISSNAQDTSKLAALSARIAELEAQLYAVGAGGVGQSIKPQIQADTAQAPGAGIPASVPTGWKLVPMEPTAAMLDAAFDTEVVHTEWGVDAFVENTAEVYGAMLAAAPEAPAQQKPVAHLPCCGYTDTSALQWNTYNGVAQCHNCGQVYAAPQPPVQQEPVAWRVRPFNYGIGHEGVDALTTRKEQCEMWERKGWKVEPLYAAPNPSRQPLTDEKMHSLYCEAMKGYYVSSLHHWRNAEAHKFARAIEAAVANQPPPRQPLTVETFTKLAHRMATKYTHRSDPSFAGYAFLPHTLEQFVRAIEAAHGITGGKQ